MTSGHRARHLLAVVALTIMAFGTVAACGLVGESDDGAPDGVIVSPAPSGAGSGSTGPGGGPSDWTMHDLGTSGGLLDVAPGGPGLVAVGYGTWGETSQVWTSSDGTTWTMAAAQSSLDRGTMVALTDGPAGLVAVGRPCGEGYCEGTPIWRSQDGRLWTALEAPRFSTWDLASVVVFGDRYYAGGSIDGEAGVLVSDDGVVWDVAWQDPRRSASGGGSLAAGYASALTEFAGGIVAFADVDRTLRVSPDGETWHAVNTPEDVSAVDSMVAWGSGLVALGVDTAGMSAIWRLDDALTWHRLAQVDGDASDLVAVDGELLVATNARDRAPSLVRSTDGETWETVALPDAAGVGSDFASLVPFAGEVVAAGLTRGETVEQTRAAAWRGRVP